MIFNRKGHKTDSNHYYISTIKFIANKLLIKYFYDFYILLYRGCRITFPFNPKTFKSQQCNLV